LPELIRTILVLFALLQIKHMFADYFLQTPRMLSGRGEYWHLGRAQHAAVHGIGSAICFALVGAGPAVIAGLVIGEWVVHFNIDWCKARYCDAKGLNPSQAGFWQAAGFDQALHQLTYVAMVWIWLLMAAA
jgi:Protein of unknown function (DUF3307)